MDFGKRGNVTTTIFLLALAATGCGGSNLRVDEADVPLAVIGEHFAFPLTASGGKQPYSWRLAEKPASVAWLNISPSQGILVGSPSEILLPPIAVEVHVRDASGAEATGAVAIGVGHCAEGRSYPCSVGLDGVCELGSATCVGGVLGDCGSREGSAELSSCGSDCSDCGGGATHCAAGVCRCGDGAACSATDESCCGSGSAAACVNLNSSVNNCGQCGTVCSTDDANVQPSCEAGTCQYQCAVNFARCPAGTMEGPCDINIKTNAKHCGGCGNECPYVDNTVAPACSDGQCKTNCKPGYTDCNGLYADGCEIATHNNVNNCGECGNKCTAPSGGEPYCSNSVCDFTCVGGTTECNGQCVDTTSDVNHCGGCSRQCQIQINASGTKCESSTCEPICNSGWADCYVESTLGDGCETNIDSDMNNCGACGRVCPGISDACESGECCHTVCEPGSPCRRECV